MGIQSQEGYLLVVTQENLDAYSDPGDVDRPGWMVPIRSGSINANRDLLVPDPEIGGNRDVPGAHLGPISYGGSFEMYARPRIMYPFIKSASMGWAQDGVDLGAIGSGVQTGGTGIVETPAALSIEQQIGSPGYFPPEKFYNVVCNSWTLEGDSGGLATFTAELIGQYSYGTGSPTEITGLYVDSSGPIPTSGVPDPSAGGYMSVAFAPYADDTPTFLYAKTASVTVTNNIEDDDFRLGSLYLAGLTPKRREVSGSLTIRPEDAVMWKQATWGSPVAATPGGLTTTGRLVVNLVGEPIPGSGLCQTFSFASDVVLHPATVDPSGDDVLEHDIEFTSVFPDEDALTPSTALSFVLSTVSEGDPEFR